MSAVYFPNLRAKSGEIEGLAHLSPRSRALTSTGRFGLFGPAGGLQWSRSSRNELRVWEVGFDGWPTFREIGLARVRDKANLDIFWLKDEALEESANLPARKLSRRISLRILKQLWSSFQPLRKISGKRKPGNLTTDVKIPGIAAIDFEGATQLLAGSAIMQSVPICREFVCEVDLMAASTAEKLIQPNAQNRYEVTSSDLPLSCPMPSMYLWNSHPRVFLPIEKTGWAKCPYCSAEYTLQR